MQTLKTNTNKSALVYLLKPAPMRKLQETTEKTGMKSIPLQHFSQGIIPEELLNSRKEPTRFLIHSKDEVKVILFDEVVCCVAESNYTKIHLADGRKVMASKTLKDFETILYLPHFFRIHASYLINLHFIKRILKSDKCMVELPNNVMLDVSRSRRQALMHKMETL